MKTLIHYQQKQIKELIEQLILLNGLYAKRSFSFEQQLIEFLENSLKLFEQMNKSSQSAKISELRIYLETAQRGINPQTLQRLKTGKRENLWIASFHILEEISHLLQDAIEEVDEKIDQARELIEQVILLAIQSKLIGDEDLKKLQHQEQIAQLWSRLSQNEQVNLIDKRLKLSITGEDIIILCDVVCSKIRS